MPGRTRTPGGATLERCRDAHEVLLPRRAQVATRVRVELDVADLAEGERSTLGADVRLDEVLGQVGGGVPGRARRRREDGDAPGRRSARGRGPQHAASLLVLLAVAAGAAVERPYPDLGPGTEGAPVTLSPATGALGRSTTDGSPPSERDVRRAAEETVEVLRTVGALPPRGARGPDVLSTAGVRFARAALRG